MEQIYIRHFRFREGKRRMKVIKTDLPSKNGGNYWIVLEWRRVRRFKCPWSYVSLAFPPQCPNLDIAHTSPSRQSLAPPSVILKSAVLSWPRSMLEIESQPISHSSPWELWNLNFQEISRRFADALKCEMFYSTQALHIFYYDLQPLLTTHPSSSIGSSRIYDLY